MPRFFMTTYHSGIIELSRERSRTLLGGSFQVSLWGVSAGTCRSANTRKRERHAEGFFIFDKMSSHKSDLCGRRIGMLLVEEFSHSNDGRWWKCRCDCGNVFARRTGDLIRSSKQIDRVTSCGCTTRATKTRADGKIRCGKCREYLDESRYSKNKERKNKLNNTCIECQRQWRILNSEALKQRKKEYYKLNRERLISKGVENARKNKEASNARYARWRERNPEARRKAARDWVKRNAHYGAAQSTARRAAKVQATPAWAEHEKILLVYKKASQLRMDVDHIVPIKSKLVCGLHCWHNLQLLSKVENIRKNNRFWPDMPGDESI